MIDPLFDYIGVKDLADNEPHFNKELRILVTNWACRMGSKKCLEATNAELRQNWANLHANMRPTIYCNGLRSNDDSDFVTLTNMLRNTFDSNERNILLTALGCSPNENRLVEYLHSSIENRYLTESENYRVFTAVVENGQLGLNVAIEFLKNYSADAAASYGNSNMINAVIATASKIANTDAEQKVI